MLEGVREDGRWPVWAGFVLLTSLAAGLLFFRRTLDSYDVQIMFAVAKSMVTTHTTYVPRAVDPFHLSSPHASYGLGMSLLMAVAYLLGSGDERFVMLINPVLFSAIAVTLWAWAREAGANGWRAVVLALATSFGAVLLPYVPTGGSELGTAWGVALCLLGYQVSTRRPLPGSLLAGIGASIAVLMRPDSALLIALPVALALRRSPLPYLLGLAPGLVVTAVYDFGHGLGYQGMSLSQEFTHPFWVGLAGLLVSPGRGLVFYAPILLLALVCIPWAWRRSPTMTGLCLALILDRLLFYSAWYEWYGGWAWGPRFLVPAMPALGPLLFEAVQRLSRASWQWALPAIAVFVLSASVQVLGAAVRYDTDSENLALTAAVRYAPDMSNYGRVSTSQAAYVAWDGVLFDWRYFPIFEHAQELLARRNLTNGRVEFLVGLLDY